MAKPAPETMRARPSSRLAPPPRSLDPDEPPLAIANGPPPPRGEPLCNAELMALGEDDLPGWIPPPPLTGAPMSNAELMALRDEDLPSEAKPIVDSVEQRRTMEYAGVVLRSHFAHRDDVTVGVDLGLYYLPEDEHGGVPIGGGWQETPARYAPLVVPDVMVAFGVPSRRFGGSYQTWNMGKVPDFVLEVASTNTWRQDYGRKRDVYERLGVREYFVYDAREGHRGLTAWRANANGVYADVPPAMHEGLGMGIRSELVGLVAFVDEAGEFAWWDPRRQERRRDYHEAEAGRERAERALAESETGREHAERALAVSEAARERERIESERALAALRAQVAAVQASRETPKRGR